MENKIIKVLSKYLKENDYIENNLGKFILEEQLGQGGTSIVRAVALDGKSKYAIKFLNENIKENESKAYLRFKQAYINILSIQQTGVVLPQIHFDTLKIDDNTIIPYSIMLKAQKTLKDIVIEREITFELFEYIFSELLQLLNIIHRFKVIHRDLKPENIFYFNKKLVLGDFDIAKFNDSEHIKFNETKNSERLANYQFSAPEQSNKNFDDIDERADLFAFGQILYWIVTKTILRGQESINLQKYDYRYEKYEDLIDNLLQDERENRLSNINEIKEFLKQKDNYKQEKKELKEAFKRLELFDEIIDKYAFGQLFMSFVKIDNKSLINEIMLDLSRGFEQTLLWWCQGTRSNQIKIMEKYKPIILTEKIIDKFLMNTKWILDCYEFSIKSIWIFKYGDVGGSAIIIETEPLSTFGIYNEKYDEEQVAIFNNSYIPLIHYENGWTEIKGKKIKIDCSCETRVRHYYNELFFISPQEGSLISGDNSNTELVLLDIYEKYKKGVPLNEDLLAPIKEFRRNYEIIKES